MVVCAPVAHHAHRLDRQQHREGLPDRIVEAGAANLVEIDRIGLAQDVAALLRHRAGDADRQAGAGEGVAADEDVGERSEEHKSELQSLMRSSYAVFSMKKKNRTTPHT